MNRRIAAFVLILSLTGCTMLTKQGRDQRRYERYVRKSSVIRARQQSKLRPTPSRWKFWHRGPAIPEAEIKEYPVSVTTSSDSSGG